MSKLFVDQVDPKTATTLTLGTSGDTINIPSGVTIANAGTATGFGGTMTPAFEAKLSANQTVTDGAQVKVACNTEVYDTDNCYDNSTNYRFTPQTAGKYYCYGAISCVPQSNFVLAEAMVSFRFNGSRTRTSSTSFNTSNPAVMSSPFVAEVLTFNGSSDYVELWGRCDVTSGTPTFAPAHEFATYFGAFRILT